MLRTPLILLTLGLVTGLAPACSTTSALPGSATGQAPPAARPAPGDLRPADPLAAVYGRYPEQRYLVGRGQGKTPDEARDAARQRLLESIQSHAKTVSQSSGQPAQAKLEVAAFKHVALIKLVEPMPVGGSYVTLAVLDRTAAAPFLEQEIKTVREKLEAWRKQMYDALKDRKHQQVIDLCQADPSTQLGEMDQLRLSLAVIQNDAESYKTFDDLKSVLDLQIAARKLLSDTPTTVMLDGDGGDPQTAAKIADLVMKHVTGRGLKAKLSKQPSTEGILIKVRPTLEWSQDSFYFLRSGLVLQASFAKGPEAFLQLDVEGNRTKAGGVQKAHAQRDCLKKLDQILGEELESKLPNLDCRMSLDRVATAQAGAGARG